MLTGEAKKTYQREYMRKKRETAKTGQRADSKTHDVAPQSTNSVRPNPLDPVSLDLKQLDPVRPIKACSTCTQPKTYTPGKGFTCPAGTAATSAQCRIEELLNPNQDCKHCQQAQPHVPPLTVNHGPYKQAGELAAYEVNRISLPGDKDYGGVAVC